jgi:hypothetical protein
MSDENEEEALSGGIGGGATAADEAITETQALDFSSEDIYGQFRASLPEDLREKDLFKNTKSLQSLAEQAVNAQSALGKKRLPVPQEDWKDADWDDFYTQLRPETTDGYTTQEKLSLTVEDGGDAKEYTFDEATSTKLKEVAHGLGLTDRQFQGLQKVWAENALQSEGMLDTQISQHVQTLTNELRKDWGNDFNINHRSANEAYAALSSEIPELEELMNWSPIVANHPAVMKLFHRLAPLVKDIGAPSGSHTLGGSETVAGLKAQIRDFDTEHNELLFVTGDKLAALSPADKSKRERLLAKRTELYQKLYPTD